MEGFDAKEFAVSVEQVSDKLKRNESISVGTLEGAVESSSAQVRGMIESAMQNLRNALQTFSNEMQTNANLKLNGISVSLNALSSICDMVENFNVEEPTDRLEEIRDALSM